LVPHARIPQWPTDAWQMWLGHGKHFLTFPVRGGQLINFVGFVPADQEMRESWSAPGDPDSLGQEFAGWDPRIEDLLKQVQVTFRWALYDREPASAFWPIQPGTGCRCSVRNEAWATTI
jgi:salicylate hydroxylase